MPSNNFTNSKGNFTVSDPPLVGRTKAMTMGWSFEDFEALHGAAAGLNIQSIKFATMTLFFILVCCLPPVRSSEALLIDAYDDATFSGNATVKGSIQGIGMTPPGGIIMFSVDVGKAFEANGTGLPNTPNILQITRLTYYGLRNTIYV